MPRAYPCYPYVEPIAADISGEEIAQMVDDMLSQTPGMSLRDGGPLDKLARALNVDVEYSERPNDVLLDVPLGRHPVIWLPHTGRTRQDRVTLATGLGHWLLHIPITRELHPGVGIQALYHPKDDTALLEARRFAQELLMPQETFKTLWFEGKAQNVAETLNVPTQAVYDRAKLLDLTQPAEAEQSFGADEDEDPFTPAAPEQEPEPAKPVEHAAPTPSFGGYARRIGS
ncbi:ImmA/IrrE family metallo-endopeptidase [Pacificoceanicola onchidii]|uniref:ImmA/IrrE family metallo-endopeptidase n=1 Tax=Pacificoceanicola onchidii TaxID=2562685 RepID=UPI0010A61E76|nr:ImmA/IrrE family metallo-endopeptidase [Pacificoceanicola onchidii]